MIYKLNNGSIVEEYPFKVDVPRCIKCGGQPYYYEDGDRTGTWGIIKCRDCGSKVTEILGDPKEDLNPRNEVMELVHRWKKGDFDDGQYEPPKEEPGKMSYEELMELCDKYGSANESRKITLTLKQLRKLVNESTSKIKTI